MDVVVVASLKKLQIRYTGRDGVMIITVSVFVAIICCLAVKLGWQRKKRVGISAS